MRTTLMLVLVTCGTLGCSSSPIEGTWNVERTVPQQPAGCRPLGVGPIVVTIGSGIAVTGSELKDYDQEVTDDSAHFVTSDFAFSDDLGRPALILHTLQVAEDGGLTGTGTAQGDGDDLGCSYSLVLTAALD